ncbi:hypothetical protein J1605_005188 [Eschrichtius robustus]|uniref:Uncharacterized protein n=1 Tax=Eschrichtius robustus TaxID=9764 RepID=A0AB34HBV6_ESCRO|nr:hypothetical protein J1605_005188 [Eschrichtius robustus]
MYRDQTKNTSRFCIWRKFEVFLKKEAYSFDPVAPVLFSPVRGVHLMEDPVIQMIFQQHKKSAAQVDFDLISDPEECDSDSQIRQPKVDS